VVPAPAARARIPRQPRRPARRLHSSPMRSRRRFRRTPVSFRGSRACCHRT
jgi:hypothetical protein